MRLTCDRCLRCDHIRCRTFDCACSECGKGRPTIRPVRAPAVRRAPRPYTPRAPRVAAATTISLNDIPGEVRERTGRYMRPDQLDWAQRLVADNWTLRSVGMVLGGFSAPSILQTLAGRKR